MDDRETLAGMGVEDPLEIAPPNRARLLPIFAACAGQAIWGFSYLFTRVALRYASPEILLSQRFFIAFAIMNLFILTGRARISFRGKPIRALILLGIAEPTYFYFESYAILHTNATITGVTLAVVPVVAILLAAVFLKEIPTKRMLCYCLIPIFGVILITASGSELGIIRPIGLLLLICTCMTSAAYRIFNRKSAEAFSSFERTYVILLVSSTVFTCSALISVRGSLAAYLAPLTRIEYLLPMLALCIFCSVGANLFVNYAAGRMSVAKLAAFGALSTICSTFAGVLFLKEPMTPISLIGSILIIVGVYLVSRQKD